MNVLVFANTTLLQLGYESNRILVVASGKCSRLRMRWKNSWGRRFLAARRGNCHAKRDESCPSQIFTDSFTRHWLPRSSKH